MAYLQEEIDNCMELLTSVGGIDYSKDRVQTSGGSGRTECLLELKIRGERQYKLMLERWLEVDARLNRLMKCLNDNEAMLVSWCLDHHTLQPKDCDLPELKGKYKGRLFDGAIKKMEVELEWQRNGLS